MRQFVDNPFALLGATFALFWLATRVGMWISRWRGPLDADLREDYNLVLGATLTLLGLIIGFSFSMATSRYDQRKAYEEGEANAIGTAYARADLLPSAAAAQIKSLLRDYTHARVGEYLSTDAAVLKELGSRTASLQGKLWTAVVVPASSQPTPLSALAVASVNDVLNSQGYTQAAWSNRIPAGAWGLLLGIGGLACILVGYGARAASREGFLLTILPAVASVSLFLISDIETPRGGMIRVVPQNLQALAAAL